jgi:hypothetical protein
MSENTTSNRKWLKLAAIAYATVIVVLLFSGLVGPIVPRRFMSLFILAGAALTIFAFRDPGLKGWRIVPIMAAIVAGGFYYAFLR